PKQASLVLSAGARGALTAISDRGKRLWQMEEQISRDFQIADLDRDGLDEVVCIWRVYNSQDSGVCVASNNGVPIWTASVPNPATIRLGDLDGDGRLEIACGSEDGSISIFDADGNPFETIRGDRRFQHEFG